MSDLQPVFSGEYSLTREEIHRVLLSTARRPGKIRMWVQTALLSLVAVAGIISFFAFEPHENRSLVMAAIAMIVLVIMRVLPGWYFWYEAGNIEKSLSSTKLTIFPERVMFDGEVPRSLSVGECTLAKSEFDDLLVLCIGSESVGVPRRVMTVDQWDTVKAMFSHEID